jgi:uncharacterized protein involved in exopolysaccharide biosynthesis
MDQNRNQNFNPRDCLFERDEIYLLDLLLVLVKHKKMILASCLVTFALALGVTLFIPNFYSASAYVFFHEKKDRDIYVSMLKGRAVADAIIDKFDLMDVSQQNSKSQVYQDLKKHLTILTAKKNGIVQVIVESKDPELAAKMANAYVEETKKFSEKKYLSSRAATMRLLLENRLQVLKGDLEQTDQKLRTFQEKHKVFRIDDQSKTTAETITGLKGEWASNGMELQGADLKYEQTMQGNRLRDGVVSLKNQRREPEQSAARNAGKKVPGDIAVVPAAVSEMGLQYSKLWRDFRIQETLHEFLSLKYEEAKIEEANGSPVVQILDVASVPDKKSRPIRSLIVLLATFGAGCFVILAAFIREYIAFMPQNDCETWQQIKRQFRFSR